MSDAEIVSVIGGSHGITASHAHIRALADDFDELGDGLRQMAGLGGRVVADGDLLESALLSPSTFHDAEVAVLRATVGHDGTLVASVAWELLAERTRLAVAFLEQADALVTATIDVLDYHLMRTAGIPLLLGIGAAAVVDPDRVDRWLADNPEFVEHVANGGGGLLDGLGNALAPPGTPWFGVPAFHPTTESAAGTLAGFFGPEGDPVVHASPGDGRPGQAPTDIATMLQHLDHVNGLGDGAIEVQTFPGPDGKPRHVVYLPGTDEMTTMPWSQGDEVRDGAGNLHVFHGDDTTYAKGVLEAMGQAGVGSDEPVMLVGHSQGGMTAVHLATMDHDFDIAQVLTAGAPTAQVPQLPPATGFVSLEHHGDPVPLVDGSPNPDLPHQVTITFDNDEETLVASHDLEHYQAGAEAAVSSPHPSVQSGLAGIEADGFVAAGVDSTSATFVITR